MIYWEILKFRFFRFFVYPFEIIASVLERLIELVFLIVFWSLVLKSGTIDKSLSELASYFLISMGLSDIVMAKWGILGRHLGSSIKTGKISTSLVKPVNIILTTYASAVGINGMRMLLALTNVIIGIIVLPPGSLISIFLFIYFLLWAFFISFAYNLLIATLYFHFTEASGIKNSIEHIVRIFSGRYIPIYLFPPFLKAVTRFTPFPGMVYGPTIALSTDIITREIWQDMLVVVFWGIVLNLLAIVFWRHSIKKYEAVGI